MRLINADEAEKKIATLARIARSDQQKALLGRCMYIVEHCQTVESVPVVRCKECSRFHDHGYPWTLGWCGNLGKAVAKDFYCADWRGKVYADD